MMDTRRWIIRTIPRALSAASMLLFAGCPHTMVERIEKLLPPPGYKPLYMNSSVPFDTLARQYEEALRRGEVDSTLLYDDEVVDPGTTTDSVLRVLQATTGNPTVAVNADTTVQRRSWRGRRTVMTAEDSVLQTVRVAPLKFEFRSVDDKNYPRQIELRASVMDSSGRVILGLAPPYLTDPQTLGSIWSALVDSCNGTAHAMRTFTVREVREASNDPYAIAFVIDHSGSMGRVRIRKLREAVRSTMDIVSAGDMVAVMPFAGEVATDVALSSDSSYYKAQLDTAARSRIRGGTSIYDAVIAASRELGKAPRSHRRALLLFTDGDDNTSQSSLSAACRIARDSGVAVYAIAYGLTNETPLQTLARLSGGRFYRIYSTSEFPLVFRDIYRSLKNYYHIVYTPPPCTGMHHVRATISLPSLGVRRISTHGMYDRSMFTELDTVGTVTFINIEFETARAVIQDSSRGVIEQVFSTLRNNSGLEIEIRGHTDDRGTPAFNQRLSEQRAVAVKSALVAMGIQENRISTRGFGSTLPLVPNDSEESRAKNRRTEFVIVKK